MRDPDLCPSAVDGKHEPDPSTLKIESDGDSYYFDINCLNCGRSGCAGKYDKHEVTW